MPTDPDMQPAEPPKVTSEALADVEVLLHQGYVEEDFFVSGYCLSFRTLSTPEERELWACYRNVVPEDQVHFVLDLLATSLHRVNGRRVGDAAAARELFRRLPRSLLLGLYRFYRKRLTSRLLEAEGAVSEYSESPGSRSLWGVLRATGTLQSPDFDFRNGNVVQHLWFVVNHFRDERDAQKSEWDRAQFVADQICMFLDPKAFRAMSARRDAAPDAAAARRKDYDAEADVLADILEMMPPADRKGFVDGVAEAGPQDMGVFLDKMPIGSLESMEEYRERVCAALTRACRALDAEDNLHSRIMQEKTDSMILGFMRDKRAKIALRNLRILLEIMGAEALEGASAERIRAEVDVAIAERGSGYTLRRIDDRENYGPIMRCEGEYKHCAFAIPERREELLAQVLGEDPVAQARVVQPGVDGYLLRKANSDGDIGPRGDGDPPPPDSPGPDGGPEPPAPPAGPAAIAPTPAPASDRPELADLIHEMAEQYRERNPGVEGVAGKIEVGQHIVETMGHWEDTAGRKAADEAADEAGEDADPLASEAERIKEAKEVREALEGDDDAAERRRGALSRRNDAVEALRAAKRREGITPGMEKEAFLENIRRIARGDPDDPPDPPAKHGG